MIRTASRFQPPLIQLLPAFVLALVPACPVLSQQPQTTVRAKESTSTGSAVQRPGTRSQPTPVPQASPATQQLQRLAKVADKVLDQIQVQENDLFLRLNYFEKPERLDPGSFASKAEIAQWQGILQQLKDKNDQVAKLYADLGKDLDSAFKNSGANEEISARFKKLILEGFPWEQIERKKQLIADFVEEHGKLLTFYEKNWGSWVKGSDPQRPEFTSASASNIYKRLRDQIASTSDQIQKEYRALSE